MKFKEKMFPRLQFLLLLATSLTLISCEENESIIIDNAQFIEIYSRLLIIYEMEINKDTKDRLIEEVFADFNVTGTEVDSTINYLNSNPNEWVEILAQVRDHIKKIRKELSPDEKDPAVISKPTGPWLKKRPTIDFKKNEPKVKPQEEKNQTDDTR